MPENSNSQPRNLDDELAEFADQVLDGQVSPMASLDEKDEELQPLAQMVMRLDRELGSDQPSPEMAERIKARLVVEWQKANPGMQRAVAGKPWWQRLMQGKPSSYRQQQVFAFTLAVITVVVLVAVMLSPLSTGGTLTGSVEVEENALIIALLLGVVLLGALLWFFRRKL